jgi:hypothetical protein
MLSVFSHCINIISTGQKLVCPIQFQPFLVLLDPPNGAFQSKVEKQWWWNIPSFRPFWIGNLSDWYLPICTVLQFRLNMWELSHCTEQHLAWPAVALTWRPQKGPNNRPTKKLTKGGVRWSIETSSLVRFNHSRVRNALLEMVNGALNWNWELSSS